MIKRFWIKVCSLSAMLLALMMMLPHDSYVRYQSINTGVYAKSKWLYERAEFDSTPIDVAFIGTSHTLMAALSNKLEAILAEEHGKQINIVNYSIPQLGRDMHYTIVKMLLERKTPDLIIIEARESEARDLHPGTHYLADTSELWAAPLLVNLRYFSNLYRQPGRNLKLAAISAYPELFNYQRELSTENYSGKHYFTEVELNRVTGSHRVRSQEWLERRLARQHASAPYKYQEVSPLKEKIYFNASHHYFDKMVALIQEHGIDIKFFFLPDYKTNKPPVRDIYSPHGELISFSYDFYAQPQVWADLSHLNQAGIKVATQRLAKELGHYYSTEKVEAE